MLLEWDLELPPDVVIQTWRSTSSLSDVVAKGYRALFGPCEEWYLDCGYGTFIDPDPTNIYSPIKRPFPDWCAPYKNWRQILSFDPLKDIPEEKRHLVFGGEVHLWGELTDSANLVLSPEPSHSQYVLCWINIMLTDVSRTICFGHEQQRQRKYFGEAKAK